MHTLPAGYVVKRGVGVREPRWGRIPGEKSHPLGGGGGCGNPGGEEFQAKNLSFSEGGCRSPGGEEFQARNLTLGGGGCGNPGGEEFQGTYNISCGRPPPAGNRDETIWVSVFFSGPLYLTRGSFGNVADPLLKPARD